MPKPEAVELPDGHWLGRGGFGGGRREGGGGGTSGRRRRGGVGLGHGFAGRGVGHADNLLRRACGFAKEGRVGTRMNQSEP